MCGGFIVLKTIRINDPDPNQESSFSQHYTRAKVCALSGTPSG